MRIFVTGVSGQVGGALISRFHKEDVISANRSLIDLAQPNNMAAVLEQLNPAIIINAAAYTAVDRAETERELARVVNSVAPSVIAQWASANAVPLIHFSTD